MLKGEHEPVTFSSPAVGDHRCRLVEEHLEAVGAVANKARAARHSAVGEVNGQLAQRVLKFGDEVLVGHGHHGLVDLSLVGHGRG